MYAVQYKDYAFDNHKISFTQMKNDLKSKQGLSYGFGFAVMLLTAIPFVNLIVMPVWRYVVPHDYGLKITDHNTVVKIKNGPLGHFFYTR